MATVGLLMKMRACLRPLCECVCPFDYWIAFPAKWTHPGGFYEEAFLECKREWLHFQQQQVSKMNRKGKKERRTIFGSLRERPINTSVSHFCSCLPEFVGRGVRGMLEGRKSIAFSLMQFIQGSCRPPKINAICGSCHLKTWLPSKPNRC